MSHTVVQAPELSDPELITRVREGDVASYGILFSRHVDAANRLARLLIGPSDAEDLVSEAFVKVLNVLLGGGGPDVAFRAYLLTAVRRLHIDKVRSNKRLTTTDDLTPFDPGVPFTDTAVAGFEGGAAAKAFASLPERWQMVLWHLEVENQKPADIAPLLGMTANSVSALAYRAREGLRQAFLTMHAGDLVSDACRDTNDLLGGYVRGALSRRDGAKVEQHLDHCRRCTAVYLELSEVNSSLAAVLGPILLGAAAAAYVGGGATTGIGAGILVLLDRGKDAVLAHATATAATAAVVGVVGVTALAVLAPDSPAGQASAQGTLPAAVFPSLAPPTQPDPDPRSQQPRTQRTETEPSATDDPGSDPLTGADAAVVALEDERAQVDSQTRNEQGGPDDADPSPTQPGGGAAPGPSPPVSTPPTQTPTPTPDPEVDVGVEARQDSTGSRATVWVRVTGVPAGEHVRLVAKATVGDLHQRGISCRRSGQSYTCTATHLFNLFAFEIRGDEGASVTFSVSPPDGYQDTSTDNNKVTVKLSGNQDDAGQRR